VYQAWFWDSLVESINKNRRHRKSTPWARFLWQQPLTSLRNELRVPNYQLAIVAVIKAAVRPPTAGSAIVKTGLPSALS
jgi:hypothetical protein